jgi:hypothetical protein
VRRSGVCIWKEKITGNTEIGISGMSEENRKIGSSVRVSSGWSNIEHKNSGAKGLIPVWWGHRRMKKKSMNDIIDSVKRVLSFAVLWRSIRHTNEAFRTPVKYELAKLVHYISTVPKKNPFNLEATFLQKHCLIHLK